MNSALQILLSWQFLILCLGIAGITFIFRKVFEFFIFKYFTKFKSFWSEVAVPILPMLIGGCCVEFMTKYPYPDGIESDGGKIFFGLIAGMFSGLVYRVAKSYLKKSVTSSNQDQSAQ